MIFMDNMLSWISENMSVFGGLFALVGTMTFGVAWYGEQLMGDVWAEAQGIDNQKRAAMEKRGMREHVCFSLSLFLY